MRFRVGYDGCYRGLGSRTGRRGNCYEGRDLVADLEQTGHFVHGCVRVYDSCRCALGSVHRRTAADGKEALASGLKVFFLNFVHDGYRRVCGNLGVMLVCDAGLVQSGLCNGGYRLADGAAGDDHDLLDVVFLEKLGSLAQRALALNGDGLAPVEATGGNVENGLERAVICVFNGIHM